MLTGQNLLTKYITRQPGQLVRKNYKTKAHPRAIATAKPKGGVVKAMKAKGGAESSGKPQDIEANNESCSGTISVKQCPVCVCAKEIRSAWWTNQLERGMYTLCWKNTHVSCFNKRQQNKLLASHPLSTLPDKIT